MLFCMPGIIIWMGKGRFWKSCKSKYSAFWLFCHKNSPRQLKSSFIDTLLHIFRVEEDFDSKGLDVLSPTLLLGCYSRPRLLEMAAAINRLRVLAMT